MLRLFFACALICLICSTDAESNAARRVYGTAHLTLCKQIAQLNGVYAVYGLPDDEEGNPLPIQLVMAPGARAKNVEKEIKDDLLEYKNSADDSPAGIEVYTYHDPLQNHDFTQTMSNLFPGITGFPDYRGVEVGRIAPQKTIPTR